MAKKEADAVTEGEIAAAELTDEQKAVLEEEAKTYVLMQKGDDVIEVNPKCVEAHIAIGWKRVE
jgi:hypothetical protein